MASSLSQYHGGVHSHKAGQPALHVKNPYELQQYKKQSFHTPVSSSLPTKLPIRTVRPLRVNEALQFTPLASILPHDANVICLPNASVSVSHPIFPSTTEWQRARDHLIHLDRKIADGNDAQVRETLGTMQSLLEPGMISQFAFKHKPSTEAKDGNIKTSNSLSPFALMVLNHTSVEYVFPQPSPPSSPESVTLVEESVRRKAQQRPATPDEVEVVTEDKKAIESDSGDDEITFVEPSHQQNAVPLESPAPAVKQLPPANITPKPAEEVDRKRKRVDEDDNQGHDQKAVADADLQELKELIWEISVAADNFSSESTDSSAERLLTSINCADGEVVTLSSFAHSKLEPLILHVIRSKRYKVLEVEVLVKLQALCLGGITAADGIDGSLGSSWSEGEAENWLADTFTLESAFRASRTVLRIMSGGREEKLLYPEEIVQKIISLVCKVIDNCITKAVEARSTGDGADLFQTASSHKKTIAHLLQSISKVLKLLLVVISEQELSERPINDILFFAIRMLFVENASTEKDSVLGVQKFEKFRRMAMDITSAVYSRYEDQRDFILHEILDSLQKLPTTKMHGRQFKLADGSRLQLTSVLLMKLVSTSGSGGISVIKHKSRRVLPDVSKATQPQPVEIGDSDASDDEAGSDDEEDDMPLHKASSHTTSSIERNCPMAKNLFNAAWVTSQKIINYLVNRASTCSKTGEQPHRHLLDMFVEDLITVFNQPEWPTSELLLRVLVIKMMELSEASPTVSAKNMALETLGVMGTAILETNALARQRSRALETDDSPLSLKLSNQLESSMNEGLRQWDLAGADGPYHIVLEQLAADNSDIQGYHLTQWTKLIFWGMNNISQPPEPIEEIHLAFAKRVCDALDEGVWDTSTKSFSVTSAQCKLAYQLILLNIGVCKAFTRILNVLVASVRSDQVTVRARALKSVTQMIDKEPSMLDRMATQVNSLISRCAGDNSAMVRDNALTLLGKCMGYRSTLDGDMLGMIFMYTRDAAAGIKKRAIKLLKDLFFREFSVTDKVKDYKAMISEYLLQTVLDIEESVVELGRQTLEEIWLMPFEKMSKSNEVSVQDRVVLQKHVNLLKGTVNRSESTSGFAKRFLRYCMSEKCKNAKVNKKINKSFVAAGFDVMLDEHPDAPERVAMLQTMAVFAQANPRLLTQQQLEHLLQPYVGTTIETTDIARFLKVVIILRWVLPTLSSIQETFLTQVHGVLMKNLQRLPKHILNEVVACLWTINSSVEKLGPLMTVETSVLQKLYQMEKVEFASNPRDTNKTQRFMDLAGQFGHYCDFAPKFSEFKQKLGWLRSPTVPGMIIAALKPFSTAKQPLALRTSAIENIGLICEAWPKHFNEQDNVQLFQQILRKDHPDLQKIVLGCFRNFFATQDAQFGSEEEIEARQVLIDGKIGGSVVASERDAAAALIAQSFVKDILKISLSSQDDYALAATEVLASILRQGLVHPKDIGPALVALSTSTNSRIAQIALQQHETLHVQHESMFEREYMRAITEAFTYQKTVVHDTRGFVLPTFKAKLHPTYQTVKTSKSKIQTKFLANYLGKIDFDQAKLNVPASEIPPHLDFARFMLENLAFFEYVRLEDLMQVINGCEKIVSSTGAAVSDSINREILGMIIDPTTGVPMDLSIESSDAPSGSQMIEVTDSRLRLLTTSAIILSLTWQVRTFLRRLYNIPSSQANGPPGKHTGRGRPPKDSNKIPPRNTNVTGDRLIEGINQNVSSLDSRATSIQLCREFSKLMAIDSEVKVPSGDTDDLNADIDDNDIQDYARKETPGQHDRDTSVGTNDEDNMSVSGSGRKRRNSSTGGTTPNKKSRSRPLKKHKSDNPGATTGNGSVTFESIMFE